MSKYYNENVRKAQKKYVEKCRCYTIRLNRIEWADVIAWLDDTQNVTRYLAELVREDMERSDA